MVGTDTDITAQKQVQQELSARRREQAVVAALGMEALQQTDLTSLMSHAATKLAETLEVEYAKVMDQIKHKRGLE